ncbi:MAG: hypothetical protein AABZ15_03060 [Nitrospirota bacterium]
MAIQYITGRALTLAACTLLLAACCSGCLFEPTKGTLTLDEQKQLIRQTEHSYSLPQEQQGMGLRQVECNREALEEKGWHAGDYLLDAVSGNRSKCEPVMKSSPDVMKDNHGAIDAVIDKNLKDALDNLKK